MLKKNGIIGIARHPLEFSVNETHCTSFPLLGDHLKKKLDQWLLFTVPRQTFKAAKITRKGGKIEVWHKGRRFGRETFPVCIGSLRPARATVVLDSYKRLFRTDRSSLQLCTPVGSGINMQRILVSQN